MNAQDIQTPQGFNFIHRDDINLGDEAIVHLYLDEDMDPLTLGYQPENGTVAKPWWFKCEFGPGSDGSFATEEEMIAAVENDYTDYLNNQ